MRFCLILVSPFILTILFYGSSAIGELRISCEVLEREAAEINKKFAVFENVPEIKTVPENERAVQRLDLEIKLHRFLTDLPALAKTIKGEFEKVGIETLDDQLYLVRNYWRLPLLERESLINSLTGGIGIPEADRKDYSKLLDQYFYDRDPTFMKALFTALFAKPNGKPVRSFDAELKQLVFSSQNHGSDGKPIYDTRVAQDYARIQREASEIEEANLPDDSKKKQLAELKKQLAALVHNMAESLIHDQIAVTLLGKQIVALGYKDFESFRNDFRKWQIGDPKRAERFISGVLVQMLVHVPDTFSLSSLHASRNAMASFRINEEQYFSTQQILSLFKDDDFRMVRSLLHALVLSSDPLVPFVVDEKLDLQKKGKISLSNNVPTFSGEIIPNTDLASDKKNAVRTEQLEEFYRDRAHAGQMRAFSNFISLHRDQFSKEQLEWLLGKIPTDALDEGLRNYLSQRVKQYEAFPSTRFAEEGRRIDQLKSWRQSLEQSIANRARNGKTLTNMNSQLKDGYSKIKAQSYDKHIALGLLVEQIMKESEGKISSGEFVHYYENLVRTVTTWADLVKIKDFPLFLDSIRSPLRSTAQSLLLTAEQRSLLDKIDPGTSHSNWGMDIQAATEMEGIGKINNLLDESVQNQLRMKNELENALLENALNEIVDPI
jgi:hypothetical protein